MKNFFTITVVALSTVLIACNGANTETAVGPGVNIHVRGQIVEMVAVDPATVQGSPIVRILHVKGAKEPDTKLPEALVAVQPSTLIMKNTQAGSIEDLAKGQTVEVIFAGPISNSQPPQATAAGIVILK